MDPISNMLIKIKNAYKAGHETVMFPYSKIISEIAAILQKNKFAGGNEKKGKGPKKQIELSLFYNDKSPAINGIRRVSKPGKRVYAGKDKLYSVKYGYGILIISTSKGLMTNKEAKKAGLGGEIIAEVW